MSELLLRIVVGVVFSLAPCVSVAHAQQGSFSTTVEDERPVIEVIQLQNLKTNEALEVINELFRGDLDTFTGLASTNQLIVRGYKADVEAVLKLIGSVDRGVFGDSEMQTEFIPVRNYPTDKIMPIVNPLAFSENVMIAADHVGRQLVVTGAPQGIEAVRSLVARVDQPAESFRLEFSFIRGEVGTSFGSEESDLPKAMMPIAKTLADSGFGALNLMAPLIVYTDGGQGFESSSSLVTKDAPKGSEMLEFSVAGVADSRPGEETVQLQLQAKMVGLYVRRIENQGPRKMHPAFEISTRVTAKLGAFTILAASPSSTQQSSAVALVVRVTQG